MKGFSADFLLENRSIWEPLIPFQSAQKDEPWHKVVLHGIPIADFDNKDGMALVIDEIKTFNKGFTPIGTPYWLTPKENRKNQRAGSVVVAFATANEAQRAIRDRLWIAGISARVEKLLSVASSTQCPKCQGFGHLESRCKYPIACKLYGKDHPMAFHKCGTCKIQGQKCNHLIPYCTNCKGPHSADSKNCEIYLAIKAKKNSPNLAPSITSL